jgi:hypothetical protein
VKRIRFLNFSQALAFIQKAKESTSIESIIFKVPQALRLNPRSGRQRQKLVRLLAISDPS